MKNLVKIFALALVLTSCTCVQYTYHYRPMGNENPAEYWRERTRAIAFGDSTVTVEVDSSRCKCIEVDSLQVAANK